MIENARLIVLLMLTLGMPAVAIAAEPRIKLDLDDAVVYRPDGTTVYASQVTVWSTGPIIAQDVTINGQTDDRPVTARIRQIKGHANKQRWWLQDAVITVDETSVQFAKGRMDADRSVLSTGTGATISGPRLVVQSGAASINLATGKITLRKSVRGQVTP